MTMNPGADSENDISLQEMRETSTQQPSVPNGTPTLSTNDSAHIPPDQASSLTLEQLVEPKKSSIATLLAGLTLAILAAFCFAITAVIVKYIKDIEPSEMALFRFVGIALLTYPVVQESGTPLTGGDWWWGLFMLIRGVCGATSIFFRYMAYTTTSLANATIIITSMPIFVFLLAHFTLGEPFGRIHACALVLALVGIILSSDVEILLWNEIAPNFRQEFNSTNSTLISANCSLSNSTIPLLDNCTTNSTNVQKSIFDQFVGSLYAGIAMMLASITYIMVRKMRKTHHSLILFYFSLIAIVELSVVNFVMGNYYIPSSGYTGWLIAVLAILSFYGQMMLTRAIQLEDAGVVSLIRVSGEAFFAFLFQITLFREIPSTGTIIGAVLVLGAVSLLSFRKYLLALPDKSPMKTRFKCLTY